MRFELELEFELESELESQLLVKYSLFLPRQAPIPRYECCTSLVGETKEGIYVVLVLVVENQSINRLDTPDAGWKGRQRSTVLISHNSFRAMGEKQDLGLPIIIDLSKMQQQRQLSLLLVASHKTNIFLHRL